MRPRRSHRYHLEEIRDVLFPQEVGPLHRASGALSFRPRAGRNGRNRTGEPDMSQSEGRKTIRRPAPQPGCLTKGCACRTRSIAYAFRTPTRPEAWLQCSGRRRDGPRAWRSPLSARMSRRSSAEFKLTHYWAEAAIFFRHYWQ